MKRISLPLALVSLAAVLGVGVPLFLRTPVWVDVTYHDVSAWNVLDGGVHYRDVFETNLPGMVWLHAVVRPLVGWSHEAIRVVDLLVLGSVCLILSRMMRKVGVTTANRVWFVVAAALFYLFETEFIHCQRDGWMLLPAVGAAALRTARGHGSRRWYTSILEGMLWGLAVWIKPHVLVPAVLVWLVSLRFQPRRAAVFDAIGLAVGGLLAGAAGTLWLVRTEAWGPMWDVLLGWNQEYYSWSWPMFWFKVRLVSAYFAPFSLLHFVAMPLAVVGLFRSNPTRAILAALYLGWLVQATVIQKVFDYAHAPPTLLGLAVLASFRLPVGPVFLVWCIVAGLANEWAGDREPIRGWSAGHPITTRMAVPAHPIAQSDRLALWGRCWHDGSWDLKDRLTLYHNVHCAPTWTDLEHVAEYLRAQGVKDHDVIAWHDSTHPLYVWLGIRPGIRYPHVITAMKFQSKRDQIRQETFASPARYVVSDLVPVAYLSPIDLAVPPGLTNSLPEGFPDWGPDVYPWNQPVVFRSGRYLVHEVREPRGEIAFPLPPNFWKQ